MQENGNTSGGGSSSSTQRPTTISPLHVPLLQREGARSTTSSTRGSPLLRMQAQRLATANLEVLREARLLATELAGKTIVENQIAQMSKVVEERAKLRRDSKNQPRIPLEEIQTPILKDLPLDEIQAPALKERLEELPPPASHRSTKTPPASARSAKRSTQEEPSRPPTWRQIVFMLLEGRGCAGRCFLTAFFLLISVNFVSYALSTEPSLSGEEYQKIFSKIEVWSVLVFTFDYSLRLWTSVELWPDLCTSFQAEQCLRIKFAFTNFFSVIDLISILPFYIDYFDTEIELLNTQWLRVLRILRVLPPLPYAEIWSKSQSLLFAGGFAGGVVWILCASLYYMLEKDNPDMEYCPTGPEGNCWNHFHSIPAALYLSLLNFFGEFPLISNHSTGGRFVGMFIQVIGAAVMAIPAGALGNAFSDIVVDDDDDDEDDNDEDADGEEEKDEEAQAATEGQAGLRARVTWEETADVTEVQSGQWVWARAMNGEVGVCQIPTVFGSLDAGDLYRVVVCYTSASSVLHFVLSSLTTYPGNLEETVTILRFADVLATIVLCIDFLLRFYAAASLGIVSCLSYLFSAWGILDLVTAVLPDLSIFMLWGRWSRSSTVLRILKLERYVGAFKQFWTILLKSQSAFTVTGVFALVMWIICSTLMYYAERYNPDDDMRKYYTSVPTAMWVTLLNLTGEAPLCDYTVHGKIITAMMGFFGVGFVSIPMGLLGGGFQDALEQEQEEEEKKGQSSSPKGATSEKDENEQLLDLVREEERTPRAKIHKFLQGSADNQIDDEDPWEARAVRFEKLVFIAIFASATVATLETMPGLIPAQGMYSIALAIFELSITALFSFEYGLRYYSAPESPTWKNMGYTSDGACRFAFVLSWPALIDVLSIAPFYISMCGSTLADQYDGQLRMLRVFRLLTLDKYIPSVSLIGGVVRAAWTQFQLAGYAMVALWLIFATLLWLTESHDPTLVNDLTQSQRYRSVVSALPYVLVHLTGDYPLIDYTLPAKCCLFFSLLFAVGVVAVPAGLMASGFGKELARFRQLEREKASAAHTKVGRFLLRWIRMRRFRKAIRQAVLKAKEEKQMQALAMNSQWSQLQCGVNRFLERGNRAGQLWSRFILIMIILNVVAVMLETVDSVKHSLGKRALPDFELFSVIVFTVQYFAQVFAAPVNSKFKGKRWNYIYSFWGIVDLITVAPWWLQKAFELYGAAPDWLTHAFIFRVVRILRILQLEDFRQSFTLLSDAWYSCQDSMVACGFLALMVWICGSVLFYNFEKDNPRMDGSFSTLPSSMYYSLIFLGGEWGQIDFTPCGQVVCIFYCVMGIALYGIPVGAVFEAFSNVLAEAEERKARSLESTNEAAS